MNMNSRTIHSIRTTSCLSYSNGTFLDRPPWPCQLGHQSYLSLRSGEFLFFDQSASPGWMHETSAQGWCTAMTQRDGMGREAEGGFRMGNTCKSMIHLDLWQNPLQYSKVISLQLIKINEKKKLWKHYALSSK